MKIQSPGDIGLPEKFEKWRPAQEDALRACLTSKKRFRGISAPVGFGKTPVYVAEALISNEPTCFVTENRGLQDQLMNDYGSIGMVDIRGRRNYECHLRPDYSCQEGYAASCPHKGTVGCPSSQAEMRAASSLLVVTNYDKWTSSRKFGRGMDHFRRVVFDEGHEAPAALARAMSITLHFKEINEGLGIDFPPGSQVDEMVNWKPWARYAMLECDDQYREAKQHLGPGAKPADVRRATKLRYLLKRLMTLATANPEYWICDTATKWEDGKPRQIGYQFDPVRPGRYAESVLFLRVPHISIFSGTLRPKTLWMLGISNELSDFREYMSDFDPKKCPIYYLPTMKMDFRSGDLSAIWTKLDQFAGRRQDRKGIIHTISYKRAVEVAQQSRYGNKMLLAGDSDSTKDIVEQFRNSPPGTILVSPAVMAGYDFPGDLCEWQFLCKIPFPDGRSKILKARQEDDKEYGAYQAANKIQQAFGRGTRSRQDQCEGIIVDSHMDWFYPKFRHLFSKSFHRFFKQIDTLPTPLDRL